MIDHSEGIMRVAGYVTQAAAGTSIVAWGLSLGDLGVIVSAACAVVGVTIQAYMAWRKSRHEDEERERTRRGG